MCDAGLRMLEAGESKNNMSTPYGVAIIHEQQF